jgi:peptide/nickel transport system permease protein
VGALIRRVLHRVGLAVFVVWAVVTLTFLIDRTLPTDPARAVAGPQARAADVARIRRELGLERPLSVQYALHLRRLVHVGPPAGAADPTHASCGRLGALHVDLGRSYQQRRPVVAVLAQRLPNTILLAVAATSLGVVLSALLALLAVRRRGGLLDRTIVSATVIGTAAPTFLVGVLLQWGFGSALGWLPISGGGQGLADRALHLVLPALTLGLVNAALYTRLLRSELVAQLGEDYLRTARAKGLSPMRVLLVHAMRNALLPLIAAVGLDLGALLGGAVVAETIFGWPGIGSLAVRALLERDGPMISGTVLVSASFIVFANLAVDAITALLDPRLRRAGD